MKDDPRKIHTETAHDDLSEASIGVAPEAVETTPFENSFISGPAFKRPTAEQSQDLDAFQSCSEALAFVLSDACDMTIRSEHQLFYTGKKLLESTISLDSALIANELSYALQYRQGVSLADTLGGYELNVRLQPGVTSEHPGEDLQSVWVAASRKYAQQASGHMIVILEEQTMDSIFYEHELPLLLENSEVQSINTISRERCLELVGLHGLDTLIHELRHHMDVSIDILLDAEF